MEKARHVAAARGLKVLECTSAGAGDRSQGPLLHLTWTRPAEFDTVTFAQDLATLMEAGLMVKESVAALARKETSTGRKQILTRLNDTMAEGLRFSAALERAGVFPPLLVATWRPARRREIFSLGCVSQQTVHAYEVGRRRIQVAALPVVARTLKVSLEDCSGRASRPRVPSAGRLQSWSITWSASAPCRSRGSAQSSTSSRPCSPSRGTEHAASAAFELQP